MLTAAGERGDLNSQRLYILLFPDVEGASGEVHAGILMIGVRVRGVPGNNRTFPGFAGQVSAGVADDLRLRLALLQDALAETAHGHHADLILEHTRGRMNLQLTLGGIHGRTGSGTHRGDDTGLTGQNACPQTSHGIEASRTQGAAGQAGVNR